VYIRKCYIDQASKIHEWMGTKVEVPPQDQKSMFIGGARGVGKSILGVIMVFEFLNLGFAVVYEHKETRLLLVPKKPRPPGRKKYCRSFANGRDTMRLPNHCATTSYSTLWPLRTSQSTFKTLATEGNDGIRLNGRTRRLMLSSPRDDRLRLLHKTVKTTGQLFMPLWTLKELLEARAVSFRDVDEPSVKERFRKYGGIARHTLEHSDADAEWLFNFQLNGLSSSTLKEIMSKGSYENLPSFENLGYLIHVKPTDSGGFQCVSASTYVFQMILEKFLRAQSMEAKLFAEILKSHPQLAGLYGQSLEGTAHYYLSLNHGPNRFKVHRLGASARHLQESEIRWPVASGVVAFDEISALHGVEVGKYYHPNSKTYETIDSFMLMPRAVLSGRDTDTQTVLVLIQVTVSLRHRVNGAKVRDIHRDVVRQWVKTTSPPTGRESLFNQLADTKKEPNDKDLKTVLPRVLVFATRKAPKGVHTYQKLTNAEHKSYGKNEPELEQYALVVERSFEELWEELESRIEEELSDTDA
jgi:hypothetical protein